MSTVVVDPASSGCLSSDRFCLGLCTHLPPQGVRALEIDLIAIVNHNAVVIPGALSADIAVEDIGEHHLRITIERIAPTSTARGFGPDDGLLCHRQAIDPRGLPLLIFWRLDPIGATAAQL